MVQTNALPGENRDALDRFDEAISDPRLYETSRYEQPYELPGERSETLNDERLPGEGSAVPLELKENTWAAFRVRLRERPSGEGAGVAHCGRCRGRVGDRRPACAVFHQLDALGHRRRFPGFARRRGRRFSSARRSRSPRRLRRSCRARRRTRMRTRGRPSGSVGGSPQLPAHGHDGQRVASASPTRDEITAAYQSAVKGRRHARAGGARSCPRGRPGCAASARLNSPPAKPLGRRINSDEVAALLNGAKGLLAIGDITSARLLLERAADAQGPRGGTDAGRHV